MPRRDDEAAALGERAWDVLLRLIRERLGRLPSGHLIEGALDNVVLRLTLTLRGEGRGPEAFSRRLVGEIDLILEDAIQHAAAFRPGHAPCHRCRRVPCEHSTPPSHRHVFVGYTQNGVPRWEDFAQHCLDLRHPDVDRLFEEPPAFVTLVRNREELAAGLLESIRDDRAHALFGQVAAGFFPVPTRAGEGRGVLALTLQIGASFGRGRGARFGLNVLGCTPQREPLERLWERQDLIPWRSAVRWAQAALSTLERLHRVDGPAFDRRVQGILLGLARRLEHERRSYGRRTRHAEERHRAGERPTRSAVGASTSTRPAAGWSRPCATAATRSRRSASSGCGGRRGPRRPSRCFRRCDREGYAPPFNVDRAARHASMRAASSASSPRPVGR
jgi:hypothetical protein